MVNDGIVRTDHLRKLDYAKLEPADAALKLFLGIYGVGYVASLFTYPCIC